MNGRNAVSVLPASRPSEQQMSCLDASSCLADGLDLNQECYIAGRVCGLTFLIDDGLLEEPLLQYRLSCKLQCSKYGSRHETFSSADQVWISIVGVAESATCSYARLMQWTLGFLALRLCCLTLVLLQLVSAH